MCMILASRNPAADFRPRDVLAATESENFAHVDEKDLPELLVKMDGYNGDALTRFGLRLLAYCFPRTSELTEAPWTEFDLDRSRWEIPKERMKMKTLTSFLCHAKPSRFFERSSC